VGELSLVSAIAEAIEQLPPLFRRGEDHDHRGADDERGDASQADQCFLHRRSPLG